MYTAVGPVVYLYGVDTAVVQLYLLNLVPTATALRRTRVQLYVYTVCTHPGTRVYTERYLIRTLLGVISVTSGHLVGYTPN